jgi:uncharacterized protein
MPTRPSLRLRRLALAACLATPLAGPVAFPALAQAPAAPAAPKASPEHIALAREVMTTSGIARSFDSMLPVFGEQIKRATVTQPDLQKDLDDVIAKLQPELELQKREMINTAAQIYATRLSEADLKEIAAFFRSPAGKRYVETQPVILDEVVRATQEWTQQVSEYVMVRVRSEMGKRGHPMQ